MNKKYDEFDPWSHFEDEEDYGIKKMKTPKVKKVRKEKTFQDNRKRKKR